MKVIKWIIIILITFVPVIVNGYFWIKACTKIEYASYIVILSYLIGFQFYYYGKIFGKWFDSKLK